MNMKEKEAKSQPKRDDDDGNDEEATFDAPLQKGSGHDASESMPANPSPS